MYNYMKRRNDLNESLFSERTWEQEIKYYLDLYAVYRTTPQIIQQLKLEMHQAYKKGLYFPFMYDLPERAKTLIKIKNRNEKKELEIKRTIPVLPSDFLQKREKREKKRIEEFFRPAVNSKPAKEKPVIIKKKKEKKERNYDLETYQRFIRDQNKRGITDIVMIEAIWIENKKQAIIRKEKKEQKKLEVAARFKLKNESFQILDSIPFSKNWVVMNIQTKEINHFNTKAEAQAYTQINKDLFNVCVARKNVMKNKFIAKFK